MAGSWRHMTTEQGELLNNENFCGMIENVGDAYEAAEECFGMIWWLASAFEESAEWGSVTHTREMVLDTIRRAQDHYREGLELGGVQRPR
jgi:hypothetical protein